MKTILAFVLLFTCLGNTQEQTPLFIDREPLQFALAGNFARSKDWSRATLRLGHAYSAEIRSRGNSSSRPGEGSFPKLLMKIDKAENLKHTIFRKNQKFRINTHVNTHPQSEYTEMGRLNSDLSTWREALVYEIAETLGMPAMGRRRALIDYTDASGESFTRRALLLETDENFAERFGFRVVSLEEFAREKATGISMDDSALIHMFMALIGNEDFVLRTSEENPSEKGPDWDYGNLIVLEMANGERTVAPYDFDRSTFVASEGFLDYSMYAPITPEAYLKRMVKRVYARHPKAAADRAKKKILSKIGEIRQLIQSAEVDNEGREIALRHLDRFIRETNESRAASGIHTINVSSTAERNQPNADGGRSRPGEIRASARRAQ